MCGEMMDFGWGFLMLLWTGISIAVFIALILLIVWLFKKINR